MMPIAPLVAVLLLSVAAGGVHAAAQQRDETTPLATTTVGIEGVVMMEHTGRPILGRPAEERSPLFLRVIEPRDGQDGAPVYEIRFMAVRPGLYDLRDWLEYGVNQPASDLPPLPVRVNSLLPESHAGDLEEMARPSIAARRWLRIVLGLLAVMWILPVAIIIVRRLKRKPAPEPEPQPPAPTLADQLRPLVDRAIAGSITIEEQARLELLLLAYWRDRLGLRGVGQREAIARLRRHETAGTLLRQLERWLHSPQRAEVTEGEITEMLSPYSDAAAIELNESTSPAAVAAN